MPWSLKTKLILSGVAGVGLSILGAVLIPVIDIVVKHMVQQKVLLTEGNVLYDTWRDLPIPIYMQFYMFDVMNPEEVLQGKKPYVKQKGPYTYSEKRTKYDIVHHNNGTVSYRQNRTFHFLPEMSVGSESDEFTTPNPLYWALISALQWENPEVNKLINLLASLFEEEVFERKNMSAIIWGAHDPLLTVAKQIAPNWFYTDFIGYFMNKNATNDGVFTIFTGESDIDNLGLIDKYNGSKYLDFWTTEWANMVNGSDGTIGPPYLSKDRVPYAFQSDICRSVSGRYSGDVTFKGVDLWRFAAEMKYLANASINPDNLGFCTPQSNCLDTGIVNISECQIIDNFHIPVAISMPHFLMAAQHYIDAVINMKPNKEEHQTTLDMEPHTGWVFAAAKRLQINIHMKPINGIDATTNIKPVFLPVFWLNESATIDEKNLAKFRSMLLTPLQIVKGGEIALIAGGVLILLLTLGFGFYKHHKGYKIFKKDSDGGSKSTDRQGLVDNDHLAPQ